MPAPRTLTLAIAAAAALALGACGDDEQADRPKPTTTIQQPTTSLIERAEKIADDVKSGRISADDARRKLQDLAGNLGEDARKTASDAIDRAKDSGLPDEAKKQLDAAREQLEKLPQP
jgi:polyhydroxyalkanoate synthesis regulator phasin